MQEAIWYPCMSARTYPRFLRFTVIGCGLAILLVMHVSVRYLIMTLFGYVTFSGLAPVVPWLVLSGYLLLLGGAGLGTAVRRTGPFGLGLGTGLLILAVEPILSSRVWGDGCAVSANAAAGLVPDIIVSPMTMRVILHPWNGACSVTLYAPVIGLGIVLVGSSLWMGQIPDEVASRWMSLLNRHSRSRSG